MVFVPALAQAQVNLNLQDAEILSLIRILSEATGKTFVPDETLAKVKVTIISPGEVSLEEAYKIFEAVLKANGFATVTEGQIVKIVPLRDVRSEGIRTYLAAPHRLEGDTYVTQVYGLRYAPAEELVNILRPLVSAHGFIAAEPSSNSVILIESAANVRRFLRILEALDLKGAQRQIRVLFLQHASAEALARSLSAVLQPQTHRGRITGLSAGKSGGSISVHQTDVLSIVPEERTNALIVAGTQEQLSLVEELVGQLDRPEPVERASLHVYTLQHASAKELAEILTAHTRAARTRASGSHARDQATEAEPRIEAEFRSAVTVTADPSTNSLVIAATPEDYRVLEEVLKKLDVRRHQVFVQALILEASAKATQKLGVELRFTHDPTEPGLSPIGGTTFPVGNDPSVSEQLLQNPASPPAGLVIGAVDGTIEFNGVEFLNLAGLARALQAESGLNVLSAPHTVTLDNQPSEILVGEERPFLQSQQSSELGTLVNTFDFKDIGIRLGFTPHISVGGTIRLDLEVEITNFVAEAQGTVGAVTTTKRTVTTSVLVDSGQMAVIGGLMQDQLDRASARVPCLGSIPIAGWLFKSSSRENRKTNLLIFIEPRILPDRRSIEAVSEEKRKEYEESQPQEKTLRQDLRDLLEQLERRPPR